jgi:hypothetical protein
MASVNGGAYGAPIKFSSRITKMSGFYIRQFSPFSIYRIFSWKQVKNPLKLMKRVL